MKSVKKAGMKVKPTKCQSGARQLEYLGHEIGYGQVAVPEHRVQAMMEFKQPVTKRDMMSLGTIGYYKRFVEGFSTYSSLLTPAVRAKTPSKVQCSREMLEAFKSLRVSLCKFCVLNVPLSDDVYELFGPGSGLCAKCMHEWRNITSRFLQSPAARGRHRYSAAELEAMEDFESIQHFHHFLYGRQYTVTCH